MIDIAEFIPTLFAAALGASGGGLAAYVAVRVDIAVLKANVESMKERVELIGEDAHEAHTRIDRLRRHEMDTR